jgi:hypothetical protein
MRNCFLIPIIAAVLIGGCGGGSSLTDADIERRALTRKIRLTEASGGLVLIVGGETITSDEMIQTPVEIGEQFVSPMEQFKTIAQASELERFKELTRRQLEAILTSKILDICFIRKQKEKLERI